MKKRLRKKLHKGEFQELGFEVRFRTTDSISDNDFDSLVDAFIDQAIEGNGLMCGGGGKKPEWSVFVTLDRRGSAMEGHRQAVQKWLTARSEVKEVEVGPLVDAWYSE
jgi:hypothetical protein